MSAQDRDNPGEPANDDPGFAAWAHELALAALTRLAEKELDQAVADGRFTKIIDRATGEATYHPRTSREGAP